MYASRQHIATSRHVLYTSRQRTTHTLLTRYFSFFLSLSPALLPPRCAYDPTRRVYWWCQHLSPPQKKTPSSKTDKTKCETQKADSFFGKKLDLPSLGVDFPSGDKLKEALSRGKTKIQDAKKKAQGLAKKGKQGDASDESGDSSSGSSSSGSEHDGERIPEGTGAADSDADAGSGGEGGGSSSSSPSAASSSDLSTPYFETTYVDGDMRIGRTGQGDVFISTRA